MVVAVSCIKCSLLVVIQAVLDDLVGSMFLTFTHSKSSTLARRLVTNSQRLGRVKVESALP